MFVEQKALGEVSETPKVRSMSDLILEGHSQIGECHLHIMCLCKGRPCGCALGMAAWALGARSAAGAQQMLLNSGINVELQHLVNSRHCGGMPATEIAAMLKELGK